MKMPRSKCRLAFLSVILIVFSACASVEHAKTARSEDPAQTFISIADLDRTILLDIRYAGNHNFVGRPIPGYLAPKCLLSEPAALALVAVQKDLRPYGLTLRIYDCYRPQKAVNAFVEWAKDLRDEKMRREFYPRVEKTALFRDGYIAEKSGHSRGSTVDLTIDGLDMGTVFDYFDPLSHTENPKVSGTARKNRLLLKTLMEKHGFRNLPEEWWHFTLKNEPHPDQYFDAEVR